MSSAQTAARRQQFVDHGVLERSQQVERALRRGGQPLLDGGLGELALQGAAGGDFVRHIVGFDPAQDGGLESAEAEIEGVAFHFGEGEADGARDRRGAPGDR